MAVPPQMSVRNLTGKYYLDKKLSDDVDNILRLQGVGWIKRKIIGAGTLYLTIKHYTDNSGVERVDIEQSLSGLSTSHEDRILDDTPRPYEDDVFGKVTSRTKRVSLSEVTDEWLNCSWTEDTVENGVVYTRADHQSNPEWVAIQTWGFEVVNGEKRYVRHVVVTGGNGEKFQARLVYAYQGPI